MELDEQKTGLVVLAVMLFSLAAVVTQGISNNFGVLMLTIFSVTVAFSAFFFEWSEEEEE
jgi:hypothetical protein